MNSYPLELLHNYKVSVEGVKEVVNFLKDKDYKEKQDVQGLSKARADVYIGAAIAVEEVLIDFYVKELIISGYGIREGVLYERLSGCGKVIQDPFEDGFREILEILDINTITPSHPLILVRQLVFHLVSHGSLTDISTNS